MTDLCQSDCRKMTLHVMPAIRRPGRAPARLRAAPLVELSGYLADETGFDLVRAGTEQAVARSGIEAPVFLCHSLGCFVGLDAASHVPGARVIAINMPASPWHGFRRACVK